MTAEHGGRITGQQRHCGAVALIEVVKRARHPLERPGTRGDPRAGDPAARDCGRSQRARPSAGHAERGEPGHTQPTGNRMRIRGNRCEPERHRGDCAANGVSGPTRRAEIRRDGHCE